MCNPARALAGLVVSFSLVACGSGGSPMGGGGRDLSTAPGPDAGGDDAAVVASYYEPAGTKLVPFLTTMASHDFAMADMVLAAGKDYYAVLETDAGRIVIDLFETQTPITVNSFVFLALNHYFDGIAFHRVLTGFMAQTGDPNTLDPDTSTWGTGGPGYMYGLEIAAGLSYDGAGVVGMANAGSNANGSQFFITLAAAKFLDGKYTIFAKVSEGMAVLAKIARSPKDGVPPPTPTRMTRVYIVAK